MIKFERSELGKKCGEENCIKLLLLTLQVLLRFLLAKDTICFFFCVVFLKVLHSSYSYWASPIFGQTLVQTEEF